MTRNANKSKGSDTVRAIAIVVGVFVVIVFLVVLFGQGIISSPDKTVSTSEGSSMGLDSQGASNINIQYAHNICQAEIRRKYKDELQHLSFDARSSRFNEKVRMFRVFYSMDLISNGVPIRDTWAYCDVSAVTGKIEEIRLKSESNRLFNMFGN
ncbi:hypothetical protein [Gynuella sp.]|uniref:hypothetical protein n=1 Tax=Gynuella sp. TaxID=2969146 RepID=UPI003D0C0A21